MKSDREFSERKWMANGCIPQAVFISFRCILLTSSTKTNKSSSQLSAINVKFQTGICNLMRVLVHCVYIMKLTRIGLCVCMCMGQPTHYFLEFHVLQCQSNMRLIAAIEHTSEHTYFNDTIMISQVQR